MYNSANCGPVPVQPGLCLEPITPAPDGKLHIFDSYVTWQATPKLSVATGRRLRHRTAVGERGSGRIVRAVAHDGGRGLRAISIHSDIRARARTEYLSDRGGLFSGVTEALKEVTPPIL